MLESGATFVARGYSGNIGNLSESIYQGIMHDGFSIIEVLQPCISFNDTYKKYNSLVEELDETPKTLEEAYEVAGRTDKLPLGIIYQAEEPVYHRELYGDWNPVTNRLSRNERRNRIKELL
jgi:2-oxoglutarate ferredoxin oxidoreductase subunit beta